MSEMIRRSSTQHDYYHALLEIKVCAADSLPAMDMNGKADPFCVLKLGEREIGRTSIQFKTRSPVWNETIKVLVLSLEAKYNLDIEVYDFDKVSKNDYIGTATIDLAQYQHVQKRDTWLPITKEKKDKEKSRGDLHVEITHLLNDDVHKLFWSGIMSHFDVDGDGYMIFPEFDGMLAMIGSRMSEQEVVDLFKLLDTSNDGKITFDELFKWTNDPKSRSNPLLINLLPADPNFIWTIMHLLDDNTTVGELILSDSRWKQSISTDVQERDVTVDKIMVHDRATGKLVEEKIPSYIKMAMKMMYSGKTGKIAVGTDKVKSVLKTLSVKQGKKYDAPESRKDIPAFIKFHNLNVDEMRDELDTFKNFNEFFYRKLKLSARPIAAKSDPKVVVSPADCRLNVFESIDSASQLWVKGKTFSLLQLLQDTELAERYDGGSLVICRLAPQDYHRYHVPVDCTFTKTTPIDGTYYTVNPIAVNNERVDVYSENKRQICSFNTQQFGKVLYVCVGATMVGSIVLTAKCGEKLSKGDEFGFFAFGGSTILVLFEKGKVQYDPDLLANSGKKLETLVKMGERIAIST